MAYENWPAEEIDRLASKSAEITKILKRAAKIAQSEGARTLRCELSTSKGRLEDAYIRLRKLDVELDSIVENREREAAAAEHAKDRGAKRKG